MEPDSLYLITNRSTEPESLFRNWDNVDYFKRKLDQHLSPVGEIIAIFPVTNSVEIIVKTHDINTVRSAQKELSRTQKTLGQFITQRVKNLFNGYAQAYNRRYNREGALFQKKYKVYLLTHEEMQNCIDINMFDVLENQDDNGAIMAGS